MMRGRVIAAVAAGVIVASAATGCSSEPESKKPHDRGTPSASASLTPTPEPPTSAAPEKDKEVGGDYSAVLNAKDDCTAFRSLIEIDTAMGSLSGEAAQASFQGVLAQSQKAYARLAEISQVPEQAANWAKAAELTGAAVEGLEVSGGSLLTEAVLSALGDLRLTVISAVESARADIESRCSLDLAPLLGGDVR
ncbi:hypothetical protein [Luethyella okanaganae]|uniref:Lipoprotein n=1 Tax=Luethyella okanaganae TaxID=69372 RepID=A0ABW1VHJ1_9MICO